ncbi:hypothetical protein GALMADRAFT_144028 [Galerina marginata CBS 339.88]|uniref:Uncharacterized protein n=1 Tax=Galerina marginata (strain CBS 339.88) TaxID=685588 RepID=A0A067SKB3_GALM3|nr:hypothetical protein GALMADRAFT_144028 [Galerina marginata CBS 339.88]
MADQFAIPVAIEQSYIGSSVNSIMLFTFLMGVYTTIYIGTLYASLTSRAAQHRIVLATITALYLLTMIQFGLQWYNLNRQVVQNGDTRDTIFGSLFAAPAWYLIVGDISSFSMYVLTDGLLIWRAFHLWGRSLRVMAIPLFLLASEIVLVIAEIVVEGIFVSLGPSKTTAQGLVANRLLPAVLFLSTAISLSTTILIVFRFYSIGKQHGDSVRRFRHILDIIVQSSAIYSLTSLIGAIGIVLPGSDNIANTWLFSYGLYTEVLNFAITGMAPTIMVARFALATDETAVSAATHLSGIQFGAVSTHSDTRVGIYGASGVGSDNSSTPDAEKGTR